MFTQHMMVIRSAGLRVILLLPCIVIGLVVSCIYVITALVNARLFVELLGERDTTRIIWFVCIVSVLLLIRPLIDVVGQLAQNRAGLIVKRNLRQTLLNKVEQQGPMRIGLDRAGVVQSVITDGVEAVETYFIKYFTQLVVTVVTAIGLAFGLAMISPLISVVLLTCGIAVVAIPRLWDKALAERGQSHWAAYEELNADFIDAMFGMTTLKSFGAAGAYGERLERQSRDLLATTLGQLRLSLGETGLSTLMKGLGPAVALIIAFIQVRSGSLKIGDVFTVTLVSVEMFRPFNQLSASWHEAFFGISALPSMNSILSMSATENCKKEPETHKDVPLTITFQNVTYTYVGSDTPTLPCLNLTIAEKQTTALVGSSGSGKSTALGLLMGFDQPESGSVLVGENNPADIDISQLVTLVPQDPLIFPGTVREILHMAKPDANDDDMMSALRLAQADMLQMEMEDTCSHNHVLDLFINEHATNLSGGQKQRLAIARALIRNTDVLILDESTSALDTHTEELLLTGIRTARPDLTLILVTHRIDTAAKADHIIVMAHGELACSGNAHLLAQDPESAWSRLLEMQKGQ
ncbi:ABC transporter ATP-binding protein/permease [Arcanobacterium phocae]|uniref:ABC transporter ATP-binding protein/permease n=2 Tax=Arcanobacterium phocae TaxID=131112 RepID=UPI001C0ECD97|nr:ABC transporter ATP-binding protein [Arcanobacterium phocae]